MLSDQGLRRAIDSGELVVENLAPGAIGPCSIDLMLSEYVRLFEGYRRPDEVHEWELLDVREDNSEDGRPVRIENYYTILPGDFLLASTCERFVFPSWLAGQLEGKSSLARLGLLVHVTAGFFDAGFVGYPTLELYNLRRRPIRIYPGMPIAQMSIFRLEAPASVDYYHKKTAKYSDQGKAPAPSMYHLNFPERDTESSTGVDDSVDD